MDEKKVRETIEFLQRQIATLEEQKDWDEYGQPLYNETLDEAIEYYDLAVAALEKQLPKKPIIKSEKEVPHTHNLGRLLRFHCPNCGKFIVGMYENDVERGGGISNRLKGCSTCLQSIDFSEYYTKRDIGNNKLNEDIEWSD